MLRLNRKMTAALSAIFIVMSSLSFGDTANETVDKVADKVADETTQDANAPEAPSYFVHDGAKSFTPIFTKALQRVIAEHARLQGETIFIATFPDHDQAQLEDLSRRVFMKWTETLGGISDSILLSFSPNQKTGRIEVGVKSEPFLSDTRAKQIIDEFYIPEVTAGHVDRAVALTLIQVLESIESPVTKSGEAQRHLRAGGVKGEWIPVKLEAQKGYGFFIFLGIVLIAIVTLKVLSVEAHYTSVGWARIPPWKIRIPKKKKATQGLISGGGVYGSW